MHFGNKEKFEGLEVIAASLSGDKRFSELTEYCRLRERGLRPQAIQMMDRFIENSRSLPLAERIERINVILEIAVRSPGVHQFLSWPLKSMLVQPGLAEWLEAEPNSTAALRWDGWLNGNTSSLEKALDADPHDVFVRKLLIDWEYLSTIEFAIHHVSDTILLLDLSEVEAAITKAEALLQTAPNRACFARLENELSEFKMIVADWRDFEKSGEISFPAWRATRSSRKA